MARDKLEDKMEGGLGAYEFDIGHETEDAVPNQFTVERTAVTAGTGYVRQQGTPAPRVFKLKGWIVGTTQKEKLESFYNACAGIGTPARTVFYFDPDAKKFEVLITDFSPQRVVGRSKGSDHVYTYTITMEVIKAE